jgi:hypothetical protein
MKWKSADIKPKHCQEVLMAWPSGVVMLGKYFNNRETTLRGFAVKKDNHYVGKIGVSHWMPVPKPPVESV